MTTRFENNETGYLNWLSEHPGGYVLNAHKHPRPWYLVLHRATCRTISEPRKNDKPGGFTERTFVKIVSEEEANLKSWLEQEGFTGFSLVCSKCFK